MDIKTALLVLASDARLASVPVCDVLDALNTTTNTGFPTFITKYSILAIHNMNVLCSINNIYVINEMRVAIGNPCYIGATGRLNVWRNTIIVADANTAIPIEIVDADAIKNAIYRD